MFNLSICLEDSASRYPDTKAIIAPEGAFTYKQFNQKVNQLANALVGLGVKPKDRVALLCPNNPYFPICYFGILKVGGIVVPLSILFKSDEIAFQLHDSGAQIFIAYQGTKELNLAKEAIIATKKTIQPMELLIIRNPDAEKLNNLEFHDYQTIVNKQGVNFSFESTASTDTAVIIYTSGTTGKPKGAELTHSNLAWNADTARHLFQFNRQDIAITVLPMFHIYGQTCLMNACIMEGIPNVVVAKFDPEAILNEIQKYKVTLFAGVPTMFWSLNKHVETSGINLKSIRSHWRMAISGGAALPVEVLEEFEKNFNLPIFEGYGMSEGAPMVAFNHPGRLRKVGSIGIPVWGVQIKIVDDQGHEVQDEKIGELIYRGHNVMKGYYKNTAATENALKKGWMHSGDLGYKDTDGYFFIVDRKKDIIIRGGYNVYPREVEELMIQHESVSLVAVIGVPDERVGEEIKAVVVRNQNSNIDADSLKAWTQNRIAAYKYPRIIEFVEKLPMNATGKILKRVLK